MKGNNVIVSTTHNIEGYSIKKYLGIVTERVVVGVSAFSEIFASVTDIFGGRSKMFENRIKELHAIVLANTQKKAIDMGANALIGVSMDVDEISGKNMLMFMVSITGTAVIIKKRLENEIINDNEKYYGITTAQQIENIMLTNRYNNMFLNKKLSIIEIKQILNELTKKELLISVDLIFDAIIRTGYAELSIETTDALINYLSLYDGTELTNNMNKRLMPPSINNNWFITIYEQFATLDYKDISDIVYKVDINIIDKTILNLLLKIKEINSYSDIEYIELIIIQLNKLLKRDVTESYKDTVSYGWICLCGNKNTDKSKICKKCGKEKNGFTYDQTIKINKTIEHLNMVKAILTKIYYDIAETEY